MKEDGIGSANREREKLRRYMQEHAFKTGEFRLTSGKMSRYYFNSKNVILTAEGGAYLVARAFLDKIRGASTSMPSVGRPWEPCHSPARLLRSVTRKGSRISNFYRP